MAQFLRVQVSVRNSLIEVWYCFLTERPAQLDVFLMFIFVMYTL